MPVVNTDAVLWYNVGVFGKLGYGVPAYSDDVGSLNQNIIDLVGTVGRNLFHIMHYEDVDSRIPPSINTVRRVHKLYVRFGQLLSSRAVPPGEVRMETRHVQPAGEIFRVYPVPYFLVRNQFMKRWAEWILIMLSEMMQHTENRNSIEISTDFSSQIGQYMVRVYQNMATELFGKTRAEVQAPGFILTEEELLAYDPSKFFTSTEMIDTVPHLGYVFTEDALSVLSAGIPITSLPNLQPWPTNLTSYYQAQRSMNPDATEHGFDSGPGVPSGTTTATGGGGASGSGSSGGTGPLYEPPPSP